MDASATDGALIRLGLYLLVFWPTVGYYVYRDSKERGAGRPRLRGLAYGVFGIAGLAAYLARRGAFPDG